VHSSLALRLGYNDNQVTGGLGLFLGPGLRIDYGLSDHDLGMSNRVGISYLFGGFHARSEAEPPVFSPLGQQSVTKIHLRARTKAEASEWRLSIADKSDTIVRRFGGKGTPPAHVMWDGKNEAGMPLPDGIYRYRLIVRDLDGREIAGHPQTVAITTTGPRGSVPAVVD
jgi:hypothetical protein